MRRPVPLLLLVAGACAHVDPERQVMGGVSITGNDTFGDGEIEDHLALVPTSPWPWADPSYFDRGTLAGDERRLRRFYRAHGFYEASVQARVAESGRTVNVAFLVQEGPPALVRSVKVEGLVELPAAVRRKIDLQHLPLVVGTRITEDDYEAARAQLIAALQELGYGDASVSGKVRVDLGAHAADVELDVTPGPPLRFGDVKIVGAKDVPRAAILEQAASAIESGEPYRQSALPEARTAVFGMKVFGVVSVNRGPADREDHTVPVTVTVTEADLHALRAGGGASFEPQRQELRGIGEYEDRDFLGNLRVLRFQNRLGYAFLCPTGSGLFNSSTGLLCFQEPLQSGVVGSTSIDLTQPQLFGRRVAGNVIVGYEHQLDLSYEAADFVRGSLGFPILLGNRVTLVPSYNVERSFFRRQPVEQDRLICNAPTGGEGCAVTLSWLGESLVFDGRNDPLVTTHGRYAALTLSQGGGALGGDFSYLGVLADLRSYHPVGSRVVLALRLLGGVLLPADGQSTPITQRFFAGGGSSLRSYGLRAFSPSAFVNGACGNGSGSPSDVVKRSACLSGDPATTVPIGGNQIAGGSAEVRVRVLGDLGLVGFADVASVQAEAGDTLQPSLALGGGLRYASPFGPVRLDVGVRVAGATPEVSGPINGQNVSVAIDSPPFAVHFSIGEAF